MLPTALAAAVEAVVEEELLLLVVLAGFMVAVAVVVHGLQPQAASASKASSFSSIHPRAASP